MAYAEEDYLQISGVQHFAFCRRQWALIHIEGQWAENARTVGGAILTSGRMMRDSPKNAAIS